MSIFEESLAESFSRAKGALAILFLFSLAFLLLQPLFGISFQAGAFWVTDLIPFLVIGVGFGIGLARRGGRLTQAVGLALVLGYSAVAFRLAASLADHLLQVGGYYADPANPVGAVSIAINYALYPLLPLAAICVGFVLESGHAAKGLRQARAGIVFLGALSLLRFILLPAFGVPAQQASGIVSVTWGMIAVMVIYAVVIARRGGSFLDLLGAAVATVAFAQIAVMLWIALDDGFGIDSYYTTGPSRSAITHMFGHLVAIPFFSLVLWGVSSLVYLAAGGRRKAREGRANQASSEQPAMSSG